MEDKEKKITTKKLGLTILKILSENGKTLDKTKVNSLRKLAASSGVEYSIIQKISTGKKDPQFTTIISLIEGLNLSANEFFTIFESIKDETLIPKRKSPSGKEKGIKR